MLKLKLNAARRYKHSLFLLLIDVDNFKYINDSFGHNIGDEILISLVKCFNDRVRPFDTVSRYAGDEFCIILPETNQQGAYQIAKRILAGAEAVKLSKAKGLKITLSIGATEYNEKFVKIEDWVHSADNALYQVKKEGRNGVHFSSELG